MQEFVESELLVLVGVRSDEFLLCKLCGHIPRTFRPSITQFFRCFERRKWPKLTMSLLFESHKIELFFERGGSRTDGNNEQGEQGKEHLKWVDV